MIRCGCCSDTDPQFPGVVLCWRQRCRVVALRLRRTLYEVGRKRNERLEHKEGS